MTSNGFSIFGFDLFGLTRRMPSNREDGVPAASKPSPKTARDYEREEFEDRPETFFWGMYPVY